MSYSFPNIFHIMLFSRMQHPQHPQHGFSARISIGWNEILIPNTRGDRGKETIRQGLSVTRWSAKLQWKAPLKSIWVQIDVFPDVETFSSRSDETTPERRPSSSVEFMDRKWNEAEHHDASYKKHYGADRHTHRPQKKKNQQLCK